jgi:autotransporter adhesin
MGNNTNAGGAYSTAMGRGTSAAGEASTATGYQTIASGEASTAMGFDSVASGHISTAIGNNARASGEFSTALGYNTIASGFRSMAIGEGTTAQAYLSTVLGRFNIVSGAEDPENWVPGDPLFVIGRGTSTINRFNALTVLKNGNIGISTATPSASLEVNGIIKTTPRSAATCDVTTEGGIYYDSDDKHFYGCDGTNWVQLDT